MKRIFGNIAVGVAAAGMVVAALASGASAGIGPHAATTIAAPIIGNSPTHNMFFYVDTVQGGGGNPHPSVTCAQTNMFTVGQQVVFRLFGVTIPDGGGALTASSVKSATVTIPGISAPIAFNYGNHGSPPVAFWSAVWMTTNYPNLGVVDFVVTVVTNPIPANSHHGAIPSLTGHFSQRGLSSNSRLTISPAT